MTKDKAKRALRNGRLLVATYVNGSPQWGIDGMAVPARLAAALTASYDTGAPQGDLFITANDDGLFPGMSQTWSAK